MVYVSLVSTRIINEAPSIGQDGVNIGKESAQKDQIVEGLLLSAIRCDHIIYCVLDHILRLSRVRPFKRGLQKLL